MVVYVISALLLENETQSVMALLKDYLFVVRGTINICFNLPPTTTEQRVAELDYNKKYMNNFHKKWLEKNFYGRLMHYFW